MTANELRENCREFYWKAIQQEESMKAEHDEIIKTAMELSKVGIDYMSKKSVSKFVSEYLVFSGFEVYPSDGDTIISWKK